MESFLSDDELKKIGFKRYGKNVKISRYALFYGAENMELGDNVRVDDYCRLSGKIIIGSFVHVSAFAALYGNVAGICLEDYTSVSVRATVLASSEDFSGECMINSTVPDEFKKIILGEVKVGKHGVIGASCVVLPGVEVKEGTCIGAMSLVNKSTEAWSIYVGSPAKKLKNRSKRLLEKEKLLLEQNETNCPELI